MDTPLVIWRADHLLEVDPVAIYRNAAVNVGGATGDKDHGEVTGCQGETEQYLLQREPPGRSDSSASGTTNVNKPNSPALVAESQTGTAGWLNTANMNTPTAEAMVASSTISSFFIVKFLCG